MLRDLAGINMVGGDIVEVSPPYDTTGATAIAGAHVAYELICLYHWARTQDGRGEGGAGTGLAVLIAAGALAYALTDWHVDLGG
jgi:hypothetical protein